MSLADLSSSVLLDCRQTSSRMCANRLAIPREESERIENHSNKLLVILSHARLSSLMLLNGTDFMKNSHGDLAN